MNTQWLSIQSFLQNQELLEAINTLSIHTKLNLAGDADKERIGEVQKAKQKLHQFLISLERLLQQIDEREEKPVLGIDHRLRQLANDFISAQKDGFRFHSPLFTESPSRVLELLKSEEVLDKKALIDCLRELRILIEEHVHTDTTQVLGEF